MHTLPEAIRQYTVKFPCQTDNIGCSNAQVLLYPDFVLKIRPDTALAFRERMLLQWLNVRIPAPEIIASVQENGMDYLLMTRLSGRMLCDEIYLDDPHQLCALLAEGMQILHTADAADCPVNRSLSVILNECENRLLRGACPPHCWKGFASAESMLHYLQTQKPDETLVLTHGDYCLPNIFANDRGICGFIDLGDGGLADVYIDIALAWQSMMRNITGFFGGKVRPAPDKRLLFDCMGIVPDWDKLEYYLQLDQFLS